MTIRFSSPADEPYGCFHPDARFHGFRHEGAYWCTVSQFLLAQGLATPADREQVRCQARDPEHARALAAGFVRLPDAEARMRAALPVALLRAFESNLDLRATLVETGEAPIVAALGEGDRLGERLGAWLGVDEAGRGENALGRALEEVRAIVRRRAEDEAAVQCEHQAPEATGLACAHLLATRARPREHHRWFRGVGAEHALLCAACRDALPTPPPLRAICGDCFEAFGCGDRRPDVGRPAFASREPALRLSHRVLRFAELSSDGLLALAPVARMPHVWLAVRRDGAIARLDLARGAIELGGRVDLASLDAGEPPAIELHAAPGGDLAVIGASKGRRALVLEPASGRVLRAWERDDYHPEHCRHPLGLFELDGRLLLVHATAWNRLDVMDPRTGERLTEREAPTCTPRSPHYLDYFHAALRISPDGERVIDDGWIWHPWGQVRAFSLRRFVQENPYESEDGESARSLAGREWCWDAPIAWLDARTVAIWGEGDSDTTLVPAAKIYDVVTGEELRTFPGPTRGLCASRGLLVSADEAQGTELWDPRTGERVGWDPGFVAMAAHPGSGELVSRGAEGAWRVSELGA